MTAKDANSRFRVGPAHDVEELTARTFEVDWRARNIGATWLSFRPGYLTDMGSLSIRLAED